jgi:DNA invertase Pin-like site-specific DNA recombinase
MAKVYGYARHFLDAKSREQLSVQIQKEQIEAYRLRASGNEDWVDYFVDSPLSYAIPFLERKAGGALNRILERGDHIIITHLVCAFASGSDFIKTMGYWESRGVHVHLLQINIDTSNKIGLAAMRFYPWIDQHLRELDSARMRDSQIQRISRTKGQGFMPVARRLWDSSSSVPRGREKWFLIIMSATFAS